MFLALSHLSALVCTKAISADIYAAPYTLQIVSLDSPVYISSLVCLIKKSLTLIDTAGLVKYKLTIKDIDMKDFGEIVLQAKNMAGEAATTCAFQIIPVKPTIEADFPKMTERKEGDDFVLTAKVDGSPPPTAVWLCEGEPVVADGKRIIITEEEADDGNGIITTLRIVKCADEDNGKYTLLVKNSAGEAKMDCLLDVQGKPKPPKVVKAIEPKEITIPGNKELRLQCKISGFPVPKITWLRDGNEIKVSFTHQTLTLNHLKCPNLILVLDILYGTPHKNKQKRLSLSCSARLSCNYFSLLFSSLATNNVKVEH